MNVLRRLPKGLLGMLALMVLIEGAISHRESVFKIGWHWEWTVNGRAARKKAKDFPVLCFGDSQVNHGIIPPILDQVTGEKSLNLALSGGQAATSYFQLRRAIESGARPKTVVIDFFQLLLNHGHQENTPRWPDYLSLRELVEMTLAVKEPDFLAHNLLARSLVSFRERDQIRYGVTSSFSGNFVTQHDEADADRRNWRLNNGALVYNPMPNWNAGDLEVFFQRAFPNRPWINPYHRHFLEKFFDLADQNQIQVLWLAHPLPPEVRDLFTKYGADERLDRLVAEVQARHKNVTFLDARKCGYPREVFVDHGHLDRIGARALTTDVGNVIKQSRTGTLAKRINLPAFRPLPDDPAIEDIHQSRQIINARLIRNTIVR